MFENNPAKILLIEDERSIRGFITINLKRHKFTVIEATTGEEGLQKVKTERPDLVLLDVMLPGIDGFDVCCSLRKDFPHIAVIMLTARGEDMDKLMGLELGADDYIVKPFNPLELTARIHAVLRRVKQPVSKPKRNMESGPFRLDLQARRFFKNEQEIDVTPREFNILKMFMTNSAQALSRDEILDLSWGTDFVGDPKTVDVHIRRLREKIEDNPSRPAYIETVWGFGYCWRGEHHARD
ncbi:response regulator transcription factor [Aneurinibacillus danicus]|uniref:DNA-binding response regulator n=1 Tax=Aneurinibacillus danicus TaxID=267746 RepID=A0A511VBE8_9BACL|nr:response regulator transcription factor [Aneurinibacillus danicus]GEN36257.1 DNA-binding response regulator [Aneurinibacillus danicus]